MLLVIQRLPCIGLFERVEYAQLGGCSVAVVALHRRLWARPQDVAVVKLLNPVDRVNRQLAQQFLGRVQKRSADVPALRESGR